MYLIHVVPMAQAKLILTQVAEHIFVCGKMQELRKIEHPRHAGLEGHVEELAWVHWGLEGYHDAELLGIITVPKNGHEVRMLYPHLCPLHQIPELMISDPQGRTVEIDIWLLDHNDLPLVARLVCEGYAPVPQQLVQGHRCDFLTSKAPI